MNLLPLLILFTILLLIGAGIAFFWAVDHDQFEDMDTPGLLPLADAEPDSPAAAQADSGIPDEGAQAPEPAGAATPAAAADDREAADRTDRADPANAATGAADAGASAPRTGRS